MRVAALFLISTNTDEIWHEIILFFFLFFFFVVLFFKAADEYRDQSQYKSHRAKRTKHFEQHSVKKQTFSSKSSSVTQKTGQQNQFKTVRLSNIPIPSAAGGNVSGKENKLISFQVFDGKIRNMSLR